MLNETLWGGARSRASIVQWYLEELKVPYEFVLLDRQNGEPRFPESHCGAEKLRGPL